MAQFIEAITNKGISKDDAKEVVIAWTFDIIKNANYNVYLLNGLLWCIFSHSTATFAGI